jgi:hypothetical protein
MVARLIVLVGLAGCVAWAAWMVAPPGPVAAKGPGDFSVENALGHVRAMAEQGPHPAGSAANERVRAYLVEQLTRLGMEPRVLTGVAMGRREVREITVKSIVARLRGTEGGPAVMLAAHYDSVPSGPGAGDDAAGVAGILEACRALRAGPAPRRDVLVVLTDGEEMGLVGARTLFTSDARLLREALGGQDVRSAIGVAMNFEARGTAGPSLMFETGPGNLGVIRHFAQADPWPQANSLSYDVYRMLPNDTDFTIFKRPKAMGGGDLQGLNFAFIRNVFWYHTKFDTPENLSPASAFHHGSHALAMARYFAGLSAEEMRAIRAEPGNAVYFNVTPRTLVWYPARWVWPLMILQGVLTIAALAVGIGRGVITEPGLFGGVARVVLALAAGPAAVYGLSLLLPPVRAPGTFAWEVAVAMAVAGVTTVAAAVTPVRLRRREGAVRGGGRVAEFAGAMLVLLAGLGVACGLYVPGGSFLIVWPGSFLAVGVMVAALGARAEEEGVEGTDGDPGRRDGRLRSRRSAPAWGAVVAVVVVAPAIVLWGPLIVQLFTALGMPMAWACSVLVVVAVGLVVAAFTPLAIAASATGGRRVATPVDPG